jgi:hypothetical protein
MARLESQHNLGYVPTPDEMTPIIASWFSASSRYRAADPAAGDAQALKDFTATIGQSVEKWAIEISPFRAEAARANADIVLPASFYKMRWDPRSVSIVYNNPPYDENREKRDPKTGRYVRHERLFLTGCTYHLGVGGHQVAIVPRKMLGDETLVRHMVGWYDQIMVMRFPDGFYDAYNQIVIFMIGRRGKYQPPKKWQFENLHQCYKEEGKVSIRPLTGGDGRFVIPATPKGKHTFNFVPTDPGQLMSLANSMSPLGTTTWERLTHIPPLGSPINPALPPKVGHLAMQISSNDAGVMRLGDMIIKGTVHKVVTEDRKPELGNDGEYMGTKVEAKESLETRIAIVRDYGETELITDGQEVAEFITTHASEMGDALMQRNTPTYNFDPTPEEWETVSRIATRFEPLPGRAERGLFKMQKNTTIAAARVMRKYNHAILNFEMGTGKTLSSVAVADLIGEWPILTVVPGHMLYKWQKTWREGSDRANPVEARIISRPVTTNSKPKVTLGHWLDSKANEQGVDLHLIPEAVYESILASDLHLTDAEKHAINVTLKKNPIADITLLYGIKIDGFLWENTLVNDASWFNSTVRKAIKDLGHGLKVIGTPKRFQVEPVAANDQGRRVTFVVNCQQNGTTNDVMSLMKRKFSARMTGSKPIRPSFSIGGDGIHITMYDRDEYTIFDFFTDLDAGFLGEKAVAIVGFEPAKWGIGVNTERPAYRVVTRKVWNENVKEYQIRRMAMCSTCGGLHFIKSKMDHFCKLIVTEPVLDVHGKIVEHKERECGGAMVEFSRQRRESLSRIVQRKFKDRFKMYVIDEMHKAKGGDNEIGAMDGRFCSVIKYSLALTGTIFGGEASSLFYLLYRRNRELRNLYAYVEGKTTWVDHYGLWKHRWVEKEDEYSRSSMTGQKRYSKGASELPGVSPAVIRYLLPITIFGKITDLGYTLPPLHEVVDVIKMTEAQKNQYDDFNGEYLDEALEIMQSLKDKGGVSSWFANIRFRPNSGFRDELAEYIGKKSGAHLSYELPAVTTEEKPYLPKEEKLIEVIKANLAQGKKTLVFAEQTGTRDIRNRLVDVLERAIPTVRVQSLKTSVKPAQREAWIAQNAPHLDILICNPKLVETGLDLVMFSDIRFYGLPLSLYTLWQAMRRVWRLGQVRDVTCGFMVYEDTIEHALLSRVGAKLKAAMTLYGDQASGAIVETDDSDIQADIIRKAMANKTYDALGDFNDDGDMTLVQGLFSQPDDKVVMVNESPMGSPVATSPYQTVLDLGEEVIEELIGAGTVQLNMFGGYTKVNRKGKHI